MAQISVSNLTFYYEGSADNVFEDVSFSIDTDWRLGFIGRNGKGKTTFLKLLMGEYEYVGKISAGTDFDYFPYRITDDMMRMCAADFVEDLKAGCELWRVVCELDGLDADAELLYRPFGTLSYGERTKVMLAVLFSGENDFLLIDEPTNHLDMAARDTVKKYLRTKRGFILVSHDRDLLDACADHILALNRCTIEVQSGNFSSWWENKQKGDAFARAENDRHRREIGKLKRASEQTRQWADKSERSKIGFDPVKEHDRGKGARAYIGAKTKKLQSRVKQIEERLDREISEKEGLLRDIETPVDLKLFPLKYHKDTLVLARDYGMGYERGKPPVFDGLSFGINQGDRVFLRGSNGCGKSSLIKMIVAGSRGESDLSGFGGGFFQSGELGIASGIIISYINQDTSFLKGSVADFCREKGFDESLFCALLRQLDFERVQFSKDMADFSEGQKKKVLIAASLLTPAHLYIWDEPLNYIDVFSRIQLEELILAYKPTMLVVEHDERFCERIATKVVDFSPENPFAI